MSDQDELCDHGVLMDNECTDCWTTAIAISIVDVGIHAYMDVSGGFNRAAMREAASDMLRMLIERAHGIPWSAELLNGVIAELDEAGA